MTTLQPLAIRQPETQNPSSAPSSFQTSIHGMTTEDARTPTRDSFAAANGKRTLPLSPTAEEHFPDFPNRSNLQREGSQRSSNSQAIQDHDTEMGGSEDDVEGSENDSQDDGTERPIKKKKKGQRFFCTEYPPCNLSFTRSEHLARHIRKHTGERPFQCHCSRRFSRLDNLRQHAQTVHVNEDIPGDSLAATGTRFQRQIRTERVRTPGSRARASTSGSQSGPRGHGRNLSTSSIASTASNMSSISTLSHENSGRRPHSMTLGDQRRGGLTIDTLRASPTHNYSYANQSTSGNTTPTSHYIGTPNSPFGSTLGSPITITRNPNNGPWADRHIGRRLSVPSGTTVFHVGSQPLQFQNHPPTPIIPSTSSSTLGSPTASTFSAARSDVPAEDWRRRTWHPNTYSNYSYPRPPTSGLSYSQTPNEPRPAFTPQALAAAGQTPKLPGIEAFDQMSNRPVTPPQHIQPPPNSMLTPGQVSLHHGIDRRQPGQGHQRGVHSWDMSLHQNLTRLEITGDTPPRETRVWIQQPAYNAENVTKSASQHPAAQPNLVAPSGHPLQVPPQLILPSQPAQSVRSIEHDPLVVQPSPPRSESQPQITSPSATQHASWSTSMPHKLMRRPGQPSADSSSSGDSVPTPGSYRDYQPQAIHANGYIEPPSTAPGPKYALFPTHQMTGQSREPQFPRRPDTSGLDALVAVATRESRQLPANH